MGAMPFRKISDHSQQGIVRVCVVAAWERLVGGRSAHITDLRRVRPISDLASKKSNPSFLPYGKNEGRSVFSFLRFTFISVVRWMRKRRQEKSQEKRSEDNNEAVEWVPIVLSTRREMTVFLGLALMILFSISFSNGMKTVQAQVLSQKGEIIQSATSALEKLLSIGQALEAGKLDETMAKFQDASNAFATLERKFQTPSSLLLRVVAVLPINTRWSEGAKVATIGRLLTEAGEEIIAIVRETQGGANSGEMVRLASVHAQGAYKRLSKAQTIIQSLGSTSPLITKFSGMLDTVKGRVGILSDASGALEAAMGGNQLKRYLVVFLNSDELRPSGGFMGSFALVDVAAGSIVAEEFPKGGSYDLQGSLGRSIAPPRPLAVFNAKWQFQDLNWWSHWPTSARTIKEFYEASGGPTVDGVVAITSPVLERILEVTGPVTVAGETLDRSNVIAVIQRKVELEYDRKLNAPKQYIADLAIALQEKVKTLPPEQLLKLFQLADAAIAEKLVLAWAIAPELNDRFRRLGVAGEVAVTAGDYLQVVLANIGGGKTDRVITTEYDLVSTAAEDGRMTNRLRIRRKHNGKPGELFYGVKNTTYARVYVPSGSRLVSASGFVPAPRGVKQATSLVSAFSPDVQEYDDRSVKHSRWNVIETKEYDKTVFGGWWELHAGASQEIELVYELPMLLQSDEAHILSVQKQPGGIAAQFQYQITLPESSVSTRAFPESSASLANPRQIIYNASALSHDQWYGVITHF